MENIKNKDLPKWKKMANPVMWSFISWMDLLNNLTDKLAKDSYKYNYPNLSISNKFRA